MRGICFKESMFRGVISGRKTVTRRMNDLYEVGEVLFLKEPYRVETGNVIKYKFSSLQPDKEKWRNKLFMKEDYARYYIKITGKRRERLQDITEEDAIKEGIQEVAFYPDDGYPLSVGYTAGLDDGKSMLFTSAVKAFSALIDKINGPCTWDSNPMVTRYEFELIYL